MERIEESRLMDPHNRVEGHILLVSPLTGPVVPLASVPDPVFSEGLFGDGIGIDPLVGQLVAHRPRRHAANG